MPRRFANGEDHKLTSFCQFGRHRRGRQILLGLNPRCRPVTLPQPRADALNRAPETMTIRAERQAQTFGHLFLALERLEVRVPTAR